MAVQVVFSEIVNVTGTPQLTLETGATDAIATYTSGTGTNTLVFTYTIAAGENSLDLDYVGTTSLDANGGTIRDGGLNDAVLTLATPGAAGSLGANKAIVIDTTSSVITGVTSTTANGYYNVPDVISIKVNFDENVTVTGTPRLKLETGGPTTYATYSSGTGTSQLTFTYTVASGENTPDLDYFDTNSLELNGGTLRDSVLNNATLTLPAPGAAGSLGANKAIVIDTNIPSAIGDADLDPASDSGSFNNDNVTNDTTPTLNYTFTDEPGNTIKVYDGATLVCTTVADAFTAQWSCTTSVLSE